MIVLDTDVLSEIMQSIPNGNVIRWLDRQDWPSLWTSSVTVFEVRTGIESWHMEGAGSIFPAHSKSC
jgi:predicted nucleic acid-binding protein